MDIASHVQLGKSNHIILNKTILNHKKLELQTNIHTSITFVILTILATAIIFVFLIYKLRQRRINAN